MTFAASLHPEYIFYMRKEVEEKEEIIDIICERQEMKMKSRRAPPGVTVEEDVPVRKHLTEKEQEAKDIPKIKELKTRLKSEVKTYFSQICAVWMMQISFAGFILFDSV